MGIYEQMLKVPTSEMLKRLGELDKLDMAWSEEQERLSAKRDAILEERRLLMQMFQVIDRAGFVAWQESRKKQ